MITWRIQCWLFNTLFFLGFLAQLRVFTISVEKGISAEKAYEDGSAVRGWCIEVIRNLNDWEAAKYAELLHLLSEVNMIIERDQLVWKHRKNRMFSVNSYYELLMGEGDSRFGCFPARRIWKAQAPPKVVFFAWEACRERILTINNLMKRGRVMVNGCYMCMQEVEPYKHLLLPCPAAYSIWTMVYGLLGVSWVMSGSVKDEIEA